MERNRRRRQPRARSRSGRKQDRRTDEIVLRLAYRPPCDWTHLQRFLAARDRRPAGQLRRGAHADPAQYVALRALGEPDAFLASDLVIRRMASEGGTTMTASALEKRSQRWRPWRAYAAIHLWAAAMEKRGNTVRLDFR